MEAHNIEEKGKNMAETKETVEYITVAEFAEKAGVSKQAVYQRLNKKLKPYVKTVDGAKMLDTKALKEVYGQSVEQGVEQELEQENQGNSKENQDIIQALLEQLKTKDIQISELNERLADEQRNHSRTQLLLVEKEHKLQMIEDLQKKQMEGKNESEQGTNTSELQPGEEKNVSSEEIYKGMTEEFKQDLRNALETKEFSTVTQKYAIKPAAVYRYLCILREFEEEGEQIYKSPQELNQNEEREQMKKRIEDLEKENQELKTRKWWEFWKK